MTHLGQYGPEAVCVFFSLLPVLLLRPHQLPRESRFDDVTQSRIFFLVFTSCGLVASTFVRRTIPGFEDAPNATFLVTSAFWFLGTWTLTTPFFLVVTGRLPLPLRREVGRLEKSS